MKRNVMGCGEELETGDRIARVLLTDGMTLNYVVDAVRNGLAGEQLVR